MLKKKLFWEVFLSALFVAAATVVVYGRLAGDTRFWNAQMVWSIILAAGWMIVATGYYHQGWMVRTCKSSTHVSVVLPSAVFIVQCVLFVKGIFYNDWSLIAGALLVNSGVVFNLYQIYKVKLVNSY